MSLFAKIGAFALAAALSVLGSHGLHAQAWPNKPIRMLVGFPAGGPTDVVARLVSERVAAQTGQRIIVDNRPGAAGNIAVEIPAKSNADGHTLLYSSNAKMYRAELARWTKVAKDAGLKAE